MTRPTTFRRASPPRQDPPSRRLFLAQSVALLAGCGSGSAVDSPYGQDAPVEQAATSQWLAPDHPALAYSDCAEVVITRDMARFSRPILDNNGYWHTGPGARVRFWTDGETVMVGVRRNYLMPREDTRQPVGVVLVDGMVAATWADVERVTITHAGPRMRLHEVVMPYNDSVDFLGVEIPADATAAAAPRTGRRIVVVGDSIAQGFWASDVAHTWPLLLAQATSCEVVNLAYGEAMCAPSDAVAAAALAPDVVVCLVGYNEFSQQTTDFGSRYSQWLANIRAGRPAAKVVCVTPTWSPNDAAIPLEAYRQEIRDAVPPDVTIVEGPSLTAHDPAMFPDTVHPGDTASASIATGLAAFVG